MLEQLETTFFLRLVGSCVMELPGECGTCYSGRSIDYLVVTEKFQALRQERLGGQRCSVVGARWHCVRCDAQAVKDSDVAAGLSRPVDSAGAEPLSRRVVGEGNSPQEAAVSRLLGPALGGSLKPSQQFSKWSVASERYLQV